MNHEWSVGHAKSGVFSDAMLSTIATLLMLLACLCNLVLLIKGFVASLGLLFDPAQTVHRKGTCPNFPLRDSLTIHERTVYQGQYLSHPFRHL